MRTFECSDVVRFTVVVPGDYLDEPRLEAQDPVPPVIPQQVTGKDPVLGVGYLRTIVSTVKSISI